MRNHHDYFRFKLFWPASRYGLYISPREWRKTDSLEQMLPDYQILTICNISSRLSFVLQTSSEPFELLYRYVIEHLCSVVYLRYAFSY
jgi:hypothetical protein